MFTTCTKSFTDSHYFTILSNLLFCLDSENYQSFFEMLEKLEHQLALKNDNLKRPKSYIERELKNLVKMQKNGVDSEIHKNFKEILEAIIFCGTKDKLPFTL